MKMTINRLLIAIIVIIVVMPTAIGKPKPPTPLSGQKIIIASMYSNSARLVDESKKTVHTWTLESHIGTVCYCMPDGSLYLIAFNSYVEHVSWSGETLWSFTMQGINHDIKVMPNGNVLIIVDVKKTHDECIQAGRDPANAPSSLACLKIIEVRPSDNAIVWQWGVWDHLVQDFDPTKDNYGNVSQHPELVNINFDPLRNGPDWLHMNSIDYNPALDQILVSSRSLSEIWVIKHNSSGGLLYRWGNPQSYDRGTQADQKLFEQHDAEWIPSGCPGAGHITVFNNGCGRGYSSADEIAPPLNASGGYAIVDGQPYGPTNLYWTWYDGTFYADHLSSAERLPNGNTLICDGIHGDVLIVNSACKAVWWYNTSYVFFKVTYANPTMS